MNLSTVNPWVKCPNPNPQARLRLFCFPYAGGSALNYRAWSEALPTAIEVCPIELPGRGTRIMEPPFAQLIPLVEAIASSLFPYFDKPFAFFGHSMGGLVSFELARLLRKQQRQPIYLFISAHRAAQIPALAPPRHTLPESQFLAEIRRFNGSPEAVLNNTELMKLLLPTLRADFAVLDTYQYLPEPPLTCPIAALGGMQDAEVSYEQLQAWEKQTTAAFLVHRFPGHHFFWHSSQQPLIKLLVQELLAYEESS